MTYLNKQKIVEMFNDIVDGIDKDEIEYEHGWWETSTGKEFGTKKKQQILSFIHSIRQKDIEGIREEIEKSNTYIEKELKKLYDSEINVMISSFWDGGWHVALGDATNGYKRPDWDYCELNEIVPALRELAKKYYPKSDYVRDLLQSNKEEQ